MKDLGLSKNISRIETEIQFYKEKAGESIWEIGRRLNHVKEYDLAHGEFVNWIESLGLQYREANRMMKIADELNPNMTTLSHLGTSALYLIATLPEEEREEEQVTADGEVKKPDEMTVRELQDLKRKLKQKQELIIEQNRVITEYATKKPEVIEKIVEIEKEVVHPHVEDLRSDNQQLSTALKSARAEADAALKRTDFLEKEFKELYEERQEVNDKSRRYEELTEGIKKLEGKMNDHQQMLASQKRVLDTVRGGNDLLDKLSGLIYATDLEALTGNQLVTAELNKLIQRVEWWLKDLNKKIENTTILEGEFIND